MKDNKFVVIKNLNIYNIFSPKKVTSMKNILIRESYEILKNNSEKLLTFSFIYMVIFVVALLLDRLFFGAFIIVTCFALIPYFLSLQRITVKACHNESINFTDFNQYYKSYFTRRFNGCYRVVITILKAFVFCFFLDFLLYIYYLIVNYDEMMRLVEISQTYSLDEFMIYLDQNSDLFMPHYDAFAIVIMGLVFLFFIFCLFRNLFAAYFSIETPVVAPIAARVNKKVFPKIRHDYFKKVSSVIWPSLIIFVLGYGGCSFLGYQVLAFSAHDAALFGFAIGVTLCFPYLSLYLIASYKIFLEHAHLYRAELNSMVSKQFHSLNDDKNLNITDEQKKQIDELISQMTSEIEKMAKENGIEGLENLDNLEIKIDTEKVDEETTLNTSNEVKDDKKEDADNEE